MASMMIDLPAPVSPVITLKSGPKAIVRSSMMAKFWMRSSSSMVILACNGGTPVSSMQARCSRSRFYPFRSDSSLARPAAHAAP